MLLSFIIPVYNCEQYLGRNLDIIYGSDLDVDDFEIVLIDDGSSDSSAIICQWYVAEKGNVVYLSQKNQGPATARNTGLNSAKGEYVWFVDADDKIEASIIPRLKSIITADKKTDLVSFGYVTQYPEHTKQMTVVKETYYCSGIEFLQLPHHGNYLWNNIYRRAAIGKVRMLDGVSHIEDACFNFQTIINFERVVVLPDIGYYYNRLNVNSISNKGCLRDRVKANEDSFKVYKALYRDMLNAKNGSHRALLQKILNFNVNAHIFTMMKFDNVRTIRKYIAQYKEMGLYPIETTGNKKADMFLHVANQEWLLLLILKTGVLLKKYIYSYKHRKI